ncbi:MAG: hypothetical protein HDQ97_00015 [Lachnospiraceae bacterium]|nr:hypothetical protein [Lachnospiraceae bacterium]
MNEFGCKKKSIATGIVNPKTTSLFFDKLWIPSGYDEIVEECNVPNEIRFDLKLSKEIESAWKKYIESNLRKSFFGLLDMMIDARFFVNCAHWNMCEGGLQRRSENDRIFISSQNRNKGLYEITHFFKSYYNIDITPIYLEPTQFDLDFDKKNFEHVNAAPIVIVCAELIPSIVEEKLEWEQVKEFRKDSKSVKRLKKFRDWVNIELLGCEKEVIVSKFDMALDKYKDALKKHGIATVTGGFTTVLSSTALVLENIGMGVNVNIATGISVVAGLTALTTSQYLSYREKRNMPIAYVYDVFKLAEKR